MSKQQREIEEAIEIMPVYEDYVEYATPVDFIMQYWDYATDGVRLQMMEYIEEHPFDGCEEYLEEWDKIIEYHKSLQLY